MVDNIEKDTISLTPRDSEGDIEISRETKYFIFNQEPEQEQNDTYDEYIEKQIDKMKSEMMTLLTDKINILTERYDLLKTTIKSHILKKVANITEVFGLDKINADELKNGNSFVQNYASKNICKHLDDIFALHEQISKAINDNIDILDSFLQIEKYLDKEEPIQEFLSSNLGTIYNSWLFLHLNFEKNNINDMFASQKIPNDVKVFIEKNSDNKFSEMKIIETDTDQIRKYMELLNNNKDKLTKLKMQSAQFVGDYFAGQEYTFPKLSKLTFRRTAIERIPFNLFPACTKLSFERIPKFDFSILHLINPLKLQKIAFEKSNLITSEFNTIISTLFQSKQITNNLTHLSFANNFITNVDFTILYNLKLNKLKEIDFHNNRIDDYILVDHIHNDIKSVGMGLDHVLILDIEGNLYGLGDGVNGQLGPFSPISVDRPMRILSDKFNSRIKKVACGEKHSLILLENGDLYAMGDDHFGQCAGAGDEYGNPIKINFELANKNNYSFVNNSHNSSIYSNNSKSMRSLMSSNSSVSNATNVNKGHPENIIDIYSGYNHCLAVAENRDIYTWGDASYGKLGYSPDDKVINHPLVVNLLKGKNATNIALGKNVSVIITYLYEESLFSMTKTQ